MASGAVAAGLCLVLGFVALIATEGKRSAARARITPNADSSNQAGGSGFGQAGGLVAGRTVRVIRGDGTRKYATYSIDRAGEWGLAWSFACAARQHGMFVLSEANSDNDYDQHMDTSGQSAHGTIWSIGDSGDHYITIKSSCTWTIRVVLPRHPAEQTKASATPRPDPSASPSDRPSTSPSAQPSPARSSQTHPHPHHSKGPGNRTPGPGSSSVSRSSAV